MDIETIRETHLFIGNSDIVSGIDSGSLHLSKILLNDLLRCSLK